MKNKKIVRYFIISILLIFYNIHSSEHNIIVGAVSQPSQDIKDISELVQGMVQNMKQMQQDLGQIQQDMVQPQQNCQGTNSDRIITGVCYFGATIIGIYLLNKFKTWASPIELDSIKKSANNITEQVDETHTKFNQRIDLISENQKKVRMQLKTIGVVVDRTNKAFKDTQIFQKNNDEIFAIHNATMEQSNNKFNEKKRAVLESIGAQKMTNIFKLEQLNLDTVVEKVQHANNNINTCEISLNNMTRNFNQQNTENTTTLKKINQTTSMTTRIVDQLITEAQVVIQQNNKFVELDSQTSTVGYQFLPKGKGRFRVTSSNKQLKSSVQNDPQPQPLPAPDNSKKSSATIFWAEN